jgi:hypothetical protein
VVEHVGLAETDLQGGYTVKLMPSGDQVVGQVTLDNCGYTFTTEAHRVARRQVNLVDPTGQPTGVSNEVVAYDNEASAARALDEFRASVTRCPKGVYVPSSVAGVPPLRYEQTKLTAVPSLPVKDNAMATLAVTPKGETQRAYLVAVFERRGAVLDATYLQPSSAAPTADDIAGLLALAATTGSRLASS